LTGKYTKTIPPFKQHRFSSHGKVQIEPTLEIQRRFAQSYNISVAAVAFDLGTSARVPYLAWKQKGESSCLQDARTGVKIDEGGDHAVWWWWL